VSVRGTVRSPEGFPIEGVLVMGADLNYAETDAAGQFALANPETALFFWCTGFLPKVQPLAGREACFDVVLSRAGKDAVRAAGV